MLGEKLSGVSPPKRKRSPLVENVEVGPVDSKLALQMRINEIEARMKGLKKKLKEKEAAELTNPSHEYTKHQKMKGRMYDRINELAWKVRNKFENNTKNGETEAQGKELPVKELWRWVKQMFKAWTKFDEQV